MQKKNPKTRCERRSSVKVNGVCRLYSKIQSAYLSELESNEMIENVQCNVLMDGLELGEYTSDFLCKKTDGILMVRECVERCRLTKPLTVKMLDASRNYWCKHGVDDWGIVIDKEAAHEEK